MEDMTAIDRSEFLKRMDDETKRTRKESERIESKIKARSRRR